MSVGGSEILFILLAVLLLFGSKRIPEVARMMGKGMSEFRKATNEIRKEINEGTKEVTKDINEIKKDMKV
jgi:sec-independent protein translocase protein TatA